MVWPSFPRFYTSWGSGPWNQKVRAAGTPQKICHVYRTMCDPDALRFAVLQALIGWHRGLWHRHPLGAEPSVPLSSHWPREDSNPFLLLLPLPLRRKEIDRRGWQLGEAHAVGSLQRHKAGPARLFLHRSCSLRALLVRTQRHARASSFERTRGLLL